ncbi:aggregation-promoting factor C-terminal-like domain-containing protein [Arthrobacter cupressi]
MSPAKDQSRLHGRRRGEVSAPRTVLKKAAALRSTSQRLAVTAGVLALVLGAGAAGQATNQAFDASRAANSTPAEAGATASPRATASTPAAKPSAAAKPAAKPAPKAAVAPQAAKVAPAKPAAPAKPVAINDPAGAQAYAASLLSSFGWGPGEMDSLRILWTKESDWTTTATNASSGAYGIVQSLPAEKMASEGADWQTNYKTQIRWGLKYIKERYGSPSAALSFHYANNWY